MWTPVRRSVTDKGMVASNVGELIEILSEVPKSYKLNATASTFGILADYDSEYIYIDEIQYLEETLVWQKDKEMENNFIDDHEKMIDFFILSKPEFLNFYSYLTEEEYEATKREVLKRSRYWNEDWADDNSDFDGRQLKDICLGILLTEWLGGR